MIIKQIKKVLGDRVLVEITKVEKSASGLIIPTSAQNKNRGKVILVGEKVKSISLGDIVQFHNNSGVEINYQSKDCLFLNEEHEIVAII